VPSRDSTDLRKRCVHPGRGPGEPGFSVSRCERARERLSCRFKLCLLAGKLGFRKKTLKTVRTAACGADPLKFLRARRAR